MLHNSWMSIMFFSFRYDYIDLLSNSTFCLIPRGRRLSSYRLVEAIEYGCIPILLSNGYALPFSQIIDWSKFAIIIDERLILQIPSIVRSYSNEEILARRQQTLFVWQNYFSSIQNVVSTTIEVCQWLYNFVLIMNTLNKDFTRIQGVRRITFRDLLFEWKIRKFYDFAVKVVLQFQIS